MHEFLRPLGCPNTKNPYDYYYDFYDLGNINATEFEYQNNSVVIYKSLAHNIDDFNRTSARG